VSKANVLVTDTYLLESKTRLQAELNCNVSTSKSFQPTSEELKDTDILLIRSRTLISEKLLEQAPNLKLIVSATAGFDHIDLKATQKKDIKVCHTPSANTESAAQLTLLLLLSTFRNFANTLKATQDAKWKDKLPLAKELGGQTLALLGFGKVGQRVAELVKPLNLNVIAYDPYQDDEAYTRLNVERVGLTELLVQADILSIHAPLTTETHHIMRLSTIEALPDHAWIINTARGAIISEAELTLALEQNLIAGAALDVFEVEPLAKDSKLRAMPNVILSQHIGAYTEEAFLKGSNAAVDKVAEFLRTRSVSDSLPPQTEWAKYLRE
jgi:D-3-phosphoglycerate dehydrogenase / 2-oxoglutarate reductase